jgi:hypothetical protein
MVAHPSPDVHQVIRTLRYAYPEIPWLKLDAQTKAMLIAGADNSDKEHLFYIAYRIARIYTYRKAVMRALDLWCHNNRALGQEVEKAVKTAFKDVNNPSTPTSLRDFRIYLTKAELRVYSALKAIEEDEVGIPHEPFEASYTRIEKLSEVSMASVIRAIKSLSERHGVIEVVRRGPLRNVKGLHPNLYRIVPITIQ